MDELDWWEGKKESLDIALRKYSVIDYKNK